MGPLPIADGSSDAGRKSWGGGSGGVARARKMISKVSILTTVILMGLLNVSMTGAR